jgi:hypothetical protein
MILFCKYAVRHKALASHLGGRLVGKDFRPCTW